MYSTSYCQLDKALQLNSGLGFFEGFPNLGFNSYPPLQMMYKEGGLACPRTLEGNLDTRESM